LLIWALRTVALLGFLPAGAGCVSFEVVLRDLA